MLAYWCNIKRYFRYVKLKNKKWTSYIFCFKIRIIRIMYICDNICCDNKILKRHCVHSRSIRPLVIAAAVPEKLFWTGRLLSCIVTPNIEKLTHREVTGFVPDYVGNYGVGSGQRPCIARTLMVYSQCLCTIEKRKQSSSFSVFSFNMV